MPSASSPVTTQSLRQVGTWQLGMTVALPGRAHRQGWGPCNTPAQSQRVQLAQSSAYSPVVMRISLLQTPATVLCHDGHTTRAYYHAPRSTAEPLVQYTPGMCVCVSYCTSASRDAHIQLLLIFHPLRPARGLSAAALRWCWACQCACCHALLNQAWDGQLQIIRLRRPVSHPLLR